MKVTCEHCNNTEVIETDNNGPIVDCPVCSEQPLLNIPDLLRNAENLAKEREFLCKQSTVCDSCGANQVQLTDVSNQNWKCRHCGNKFKTHYTI